MQRRWLVLLLASVLALVSAVSAQDRYLGSISLVPYNFAPRGSAFCNGQLLAIQSNTALFSLLGTYYGGDGIRTFALPDLRGRVAIGMGTGPGLTRRDLGEVGGEENVTLLVSQLPAHTHAALASTMPGNTVSPAGAYWATGPRVLLYSGATNLQFMSPFAVNNAGGGMPHENRKPFLTMNYVIWLQGIFPPRG